MLESTLESSPESASSGESRSLRELFEQNESRLLRVALSITQRRAVAEEIVQDAFLKLHLNRDDVDKPEAWLMQAVKNAAINHLRKTKREVYSDSETAESKAESPEQIMVRAELMDQLREQIHGLPSGDQDLIKLKYFESKKYSEISDETGLSISNVGFRLHKIIKTLAAGMMTASEGNRE